MMLTCRSQSRRCPAIRLEFQGVSRCAALFVRRIGLAVLATVSATVVTQQVLSRVAVAEDSIVVNARPLLPSPVQQPQTSVRSARARGAHSDYLRRGDIDQLTSDMIDPDDARTRFLLMTPVRPVAIELDVHVQGRSFRALREDRIASAIEHTQHPDLAREVSDTLSTRVLQYARAKGSPLAASEIRWLVEQWSDGPTLLQLTHEFARRQRLNLPIYQLLDADHNGMIDALERQGALERLAACDTNDDGLLQFSEVTSASEGSRSIALTQPDKLLVEVSNSTDPQTLSDVIAGAYGDRVEPDHDPLPVKVDIRFGAEASSSTCEVIASNAGRLNLATPVSCGDMIQLSLPNADVRLFAVHPGSIQGDQISIGAVLDSAPLFRVLDQNGDRNLSLREMRGLPRQLDALDHDRDGIILGAEVRPVIYLAVGLGRSVHVALAEPDSITVPTSNQAPVPEWFSRMDRNRDGDLTASEFLGDRTQFDELDANDDEFISVQEVLTPSSSK